VGALVLHKADRLAEQAAEIERLEKELKTRRRELARDTAALRRIVNRDWDSDEQERAMFDWQDDKLRGSVTREGK
jgi:hypothetical protein